MKARRDKMKVGVFTLENALDRDSFFRNWALCKTLENLGVDVSEKKIMSGDEENIQAAKDLDLCLVSGKFALDCEEGESAASTVFLKKFDKTADNLLYAAGIKRTKISPEARKELGEILKNFHGISLTSFLMAKEMEKVTDQPVNVAADPLFLLTREDYEEAAPKEERRAGFFSSLAGFSRKKGKGCLLADLQEDGKEIRRRIQKIAASVHCSAVYTKTDFSGKTADNEEFLRDLAGADYVITDHFSGVIFALIYEKPFLALAEGEKSDDIQELLTEFELEHHICGEKDEIQGEKSFLIEDLASLRRKKAYRRQHALHVLMEALGMRNFAPEKVDCPTGILKRECYGCYACKEICPENAISMEEEDGFFYPRVNPDRCISCGRCEEVCIRIHDQPNCANSKVYAAVNREEQVKLASSSGGVFPELARYILREKKGCVVGVRWNSRMEAVADIIQDEKELDSFSGSKYVKSNLNGILPKVQGLLEEGRTVLYSGLPCECAALRAYLGKSYENLYICEIMCHSAPSPKVLKKYLEYLQDKFGSKVIGLRFRDASQTGWLGYRSQMVILFENGKELRVNGRRNHYMRAFQNGYISRESCNYCSYVRENRRGDLTLGDFWGIQKVFPDFYDEKGNSFVMIHDAQGEKLWNAVADRFVTQQSDLDTVFAINHSRPIRFHAAREEIFQWLDEEPTNHLLGRLNDLNGK